MTKTHKLKLRIEFADAVMNGDKCFEIRENDRGYQKGDLVEFTTIDKFGVDTLHPVEKIVYEITYVLHGWGLKDNFVVFGIKENEQ